MYSFILSLSVLVFGYLVFLKFTEQVAVEDTCKETFAFHMRDGINFKLMSLWKDFPIQYYCLNKREQFVLISPYEMGYKYQYKVNLHAHSTERNKNYAYSPKMLL